VVEPGAERAARETHNRKVVVIGTDATVTSHAYRKALEARGIEAREKACPLFVPLVEEGWVDHPVTEQVARIYLQEAFADGFHQADVLVLGCTHYPLLHPLLRRVAPDGVSIVDSAHSTANAVADEIRRIQLSQTQLATESERRGPTRMRFFATDSVEKFRRLGPKFLGHPVEEVQHVDLKE
jgi:glutamate racemase